MGSKPLDYKEGGGTTEPTKPIDPLSGDSRLVGRWLCHYSTMDGVYFFNEDGTFIMASIRLNSSASFESVEHYKGNYKVSGDTIEFTNLNRYANDLSGWRNVPINEIDGDAITKKVLDIQRIIKTGTRAEVEALLNPEHSYYHQPSNKGWQPFDSRTGDIVFQDQNHMKTNIIGAFNEYEKVK